MSYQIMTHDIENHPPLVFNTVTGAIIAEDKNSSAWAAYLRWLEQGNQPTEVSRPNG